MRVSAAEISIQETACEVRLSHFLQLPYVDGEASCSQLPSTLCFHKKKWKTVWWLWEIQLQKQICIFSIYLTSHTWLCSPQALASLLAAPPTHYLNSEFLSGFSQFSHTFNLWRNEWWLLSIKKIKKPDRLTAHTGRISFPWRWGFPLCRRVSVWWGLTGSVGAEIGCSRDRG